MVGINMGGKTNLILIVRQCLPLIHVYIRKIMQKLHQIGIHM